MDRGDAATRFLAFTVTDSDALIFDGLRGDRCAIGREYGR